MMSKKIKIKLVTCIVFFISIITTSIWAIDKAIESSIESGEPTCNISGDERNKLEECENTKDSPYLAYHVFGDGLTREEACENAKARVMSQGCINVGGRAVITSDCVCSTRGMGGPWQCYVEYYCQ